MTSQPPGDWLAAGAVGRPHGLDGSFHVTRPRPGLLAPGVVVTVAAAARPIVGYKGTDAAPILRLEGCTSREGANALRGEALLVPRTRAPALADGEYWAEELEGCSVVDGDRPVGTVTKMLVLPSCEVLEVARGERPVLLVPMVRDAIREIDVEARRIDIDLTFVAPHDS